MRSAAWGLFALVACGEVSESASMVPTPVHHHEETAALAPDSRDARAVRRPGPERRRGAWAVDANAACEGCHEREARAWRSSRHHTANENRAYRMAFAREPSSFCTGCHAPEARDPKAPTAAESALGVGCVTCHVTGDDDVVVTGPADGSSAEAPHPILRSHDFAATGGCASCHEFHFPGRAGDDLGDFMQTTLAEAARIAPDARCADCHMASASGRSDHGFDEVRDPRWLRASLTATATRSGGGVEVKLEQTRPGHAFPTGDLFRRLQIGALWLDGSGRPLARETAYLARHFEITPRFAHGRELVSDNRLGAEPLSWWLDPSEVVTDARRLSWWVTLQRVSTVGSGRDRDAAEIESEVWLHGGDIVLDRE